MSRDHFLNATLVAATISVGWIGWSGAPLALPLSSAFPCLWSMARSRRIAAFVSAGYFLAASRGLPQGVATFYGADLWPGLLLWAAASIGFVSVYALLWTCERGWQRAVRYVGASVLMAIPPFGIVGWAHPLTAAGIVFPGWGWTGLAAMAAGLAVMTTRLWPAAAIALIGLWLWSAAQWTSQTLPPSWHGVDTTLGASLGRGIDLGLQRDLVAKVRSAGRSRGDTVVLPESALGFWTPTVERLWVDELRATGLTVVAGAVVLDEHGYDNVLVAISSAGGRIVYRERMPVPGSMWQPWLDLVYAGGGARAYFFDNSVVDVGGTRAAPLICYEQLIVWPILQSMFHHPDVIVAVGNGWWTAGTSIVDIQRASALAWARLFDKPLIFSFNI